VFTDRFPTGGGSVVYFAKVEMVRPGQTVSGRGKSDQWIVDCVLMSGDPIEGCRVIGDRLPMASTPERPSWGLLGFFGGNPMAPWFIPSPWLSADPSSLESSERLDEYTSLAIRVTKDGVYNIKTRKGGDVVIEDSGAMPEGKRVGEVLPHDQNLLTIDAVNNLLTMFGGSHRAARGAEGVGEGDKIAITDVTSPGLSVWMDAVKAALDAVSAALQGFATMIPVAPAPPGTGPMVSTPAAMASISAAIIALNTASALTVKPTDTVPAKGDQPVQPASGTLQLVGEIRTGSHKVKVD